MTLLKMAAALAGGLLLVVLCAATAYIVITETGLA